MKNKFKRLQLSIRNFNKKGIIFTSVFALTLLGLSVLVPRISTHAEPTNTEEPDAPIAYTMSQTTLKKTEIVTEELAWDADLAAYINGKKTEWQNSEAYQGQDEAYREAWGALFVAEDGVYKYPVFLHTYFTGVTISEYPCNEVDEPVVIVGDPDDPGFPAQGCPIYQYRDEYREVNVTQPTEPTPIEVDIEADEEESEFVASPETGASTASGASASLAASGGTIALITLAISLFALVLIEKRQ